MKQTFKVNNVKCGGCASTLKTKLMKNFGEVEVNLELMPREITLDIEEKEIINLRIALKDMGYPMSDEDLGFFEDSGMKAKSFVSCAVGKFEVAKNNS